MAVRTDIGVDIVCTIVVRIVQNVPEQREYVVVALKDNMDLIVTIHALQTVQHVAA